VESFKLLYVDDVRTSKETPLLPVDGIAILFSILLHDMETNRRIDANNEIGGEEGNMLTALSSISVYSKGN
jgi:hypothetical protein